MKKRIVLTLVLVATLCFTACGGGDNSGDTQQDAQNSNETSAQGDVQDESPSYEIDLDSTEVQQMSEERATVETLTETVNEWLEGGTIFPAGTEMSSRTYEDFVDHIGCDATEYYFDTLNNSRVYTWIAEDKDISQLGVWFAEENGTWNLHMSGATNLL